MNSFTFKVLVMISLRGHKLTKKDIDNMSYKEEINYLQVNHYITIALVNKKQWYITTINGDDVVDRFTRLAELI